MFGVFPMVKMLLTPAKTPLSLKQAKFKNERFSSTFLIGTGNCGPSHHSFYGFSPIFHRSKLFFSPPTHHLYIKPVVSQALFTGFFEISYQTNRLI
jgi:hypothetical protein